MNDKQLKDLIEKRNRIYISMTQNEQDIRRLIEVNKEHSDSIRDIDKKILMMVR